MKAAFVLALSAHDGEGKPTTLLASSCWGVGEMTYILSYVCPIVFSNCIWNW